MQLTRATISHAALAILDEYGLADVSMRRVATSLGVAPGALYWHIKNKQELISNLAELIIAPLIDASPTSPEATCAQLRSALLAHRDGAEVVLSAVSQPDSPVGARLDAIVAESLRCADNETSESDVLAAAEGLIFLTLGATYVQQSSTQLAEATGDNPGGSDRPANAERAIAFLLQGLRDDERE
ncbi:TetR family transcriptional regulator [Corynebacterium sp.]|uniref:TetR family transcriptional regulator n=1 Tax=Corynebacterium sp. TaxID=1720 RepID=UPI002A9125E3|nr:TetR family transcriptional regulator [Corynebacterium sp.]MDY5785005.1 TetR family transcriptional regulator [Corynebacterium sp.]